MKSYFSFLYLSVLIFASQSVGAQVQPLRAEEIKQNHHNLQEDAFVDDIVVKRIVVENRLMAQQPIREQTFLGKREFSV